MIVRLIEEWKEKLDKGFFAGAVFMDLSKVFDCIAHDFLIAKLNAYGFDGKSLVFFYSYLKWRKLKDRSSDHCYLIYLLMILLVL